MHRASSATRALSVRIEHGQPSREHERGADGKVAVIPVTDHRIPGRPFGVTARLLAAVAPAYGLSRSKVSMTASLSNSAASAIGSAGETARSVSESR
jgi:hypothetical protein